MIYDNKIAASVKWSLVALMRTITQLFLVNPKRILATFPTQVPGTKRSPLLSVFPPLSKALRRLGELVS